MPSDFSSFYSQYAGNPSYSVNVPPPPQFTPNKGGTQDNSLLGNTWLHAADPTGSFAILNGLFGGGKKKPKQPPTGNKEYYQGKALLNAYNWLLPYTAETVQRGGEAFGDIYRREAAKSKAYELAQFGEYAPRYAESILNADPRQAALLEMYNRALGSNQEQAQGYANRLGGRLDNPMSSAAARDITQASLGQGALQGFGRGPRDAALAYIQTGLVGEQLQRQREQDYLAALGQLGSSTGQLAGGIQANKSVLGDPFLAFAGRPSQPQGSNPMSPDYGGFNNDLFSYQVNDEIMGKNMAAANSASNKQLIGSIVGGLLGAAGGAAGLCWLAREAFGAGNPAWLLFRRWLLARAPRDFFWWYLFNGESAARYVSDKPELKARIRSWMTSKIYGSPNLG